MLAARGAALLRAPERDGEREAHRGDRIATSEIARNSRPSERSAANSQPPAASAPRTATMSITFFALYFSSRATTVNSTSRAGFEIAKLAVRCSAWKAITTASIGAAASTANPAANTNGSSASAAPTPKRAISLPVAKNWTRERQQADGEIDAGEHARAHRRIVGGGGDDVRLLEVEEGRGDRQQRHPERDAGEVRRAQQQQDAVEPAAAERFRPRLCRQCRVPTPGATGSRRRTQSTATSRNSAATISRLAGPSSSASPMVSAGPASEPAVPPAAMNANRRLPCSGVNRSAMNDQNTDTANSTNTLIQTKNTRATIEPLDVEA